MFQERERKGVAEARSLTHTTQHMITTVDKTNCFKYMCLTILQ